MINVLVAFNSNQVNDFLDNFRNHVTGQGPGGEDMYERIRTDFVPFDGLDPYDTRDLLVEQGSQGGWKENTAGGNTTIVTMEVSDVAMVEYLRSHYDGRFQVLGAWNTDGVMHGQTLVPATEETPEEIIDNPTYPLHPQYLKWMPDDVTYDDEGNEISRTSATEFKRVNRLQGQPDRRI